MINQNLVDILTERGFVVSCFERGQDATAHICTILNNEVIGFGGSVTVGQLGLADALKQNNTIISHALTPGAQTRYGEFTAYVCSANAVSLSGEIVNIDGSGNRISCCAYGPKTLVYVIGNNKIMPDLHSAINRAQNVAAPKNAQRLKRKTPCAIDLKCHNCNSPERICKGMFIQTHPMSAKTHIILVDQPLGF